MIVYYGDDLLAGGNDGLFCCGCLYIVSQRQRPLRELVEKVPEESRAVGDQAESEDLPPELKQSVSLCWQLLWGFITYSSSPRHHLCCPRWDCSHGTNVRGQQACQNAIDMPDESDGGKSLTAMLGRDCEKNVNTCL